MRDAPHLSRVTQEQNCETTTVLAGCGVLSEEKTVGEKSDDLADVVEGGEMEGLPVVLQGVPHPRERRGDHVEDLPQPSLVEGLLVVLHHVVPCLVIEHLGLGNATEYLNIYSVPRVYLGSEVTVGNAPDSLLHLPGQQVEAAVVLGVPVHSSALHCCIVDSDHRLNSGPGLPSRSSNTKPSTLSSWLAGPSCPHNLLALIDQPTNLVRAVAPLGGQATGPVQGVSGAPGPQRLLPVQEEQLQGDLGRGGCRTVQQRRQGSSQVQQHRARSRGVRRAQEALGGHLGVVVGRQHQSG